jgi:hypothetical protein
MEIVMNAALFILFFSLHVPLYGFFTQSLNLVQKSIKDHKLSSFVQNLEKMHQIQVSGSCHEWFLNKYPTHITYIHTPPTNLHEPYQAEILNTQAQLAFLQKYTDESAIHMQYLQEHKNESRLKITTCIGLLTGGAYLLSRFVDNSSSLWSTRSELYTWCGLALSILLSVQIDKKDKQRRRHTKAIHNILEECTEQIKNYLTDLQRPST